MEWRPSAKCDRTGLPRKWSGPAWQAERGSAAEMREASDQGGAQMTLEDRQLRQLFAEFDLDGSGELDREEIAGVMSRMGARTSDTELDVAMDEMDADGSGEVDFDEFRAWFKQSKGSASKFASVVADASRMRFNDGGLPRKWRGPQWLAEPRADARPQPQQHGQPGRKFQTFESRPPTKTKAVVAPQQQLGGGFFGVDSSKQSAVRDWALRRLEFDRSLEEREGGIAVGELRSAFATETGLHVGHNDQWCAHRSFGRPVALTSFRVSFPI